MATGSMTKVEREAFLADVHVGVLAVDEPGRGPLNVPVWYLYEDGQIVISTHPTSRKVELLQAAGRATLTVQNEDPPYKYISVEGPVSVEPTDRDELEVAIRYLGAELGAWYMEHNPGSPDTVLVRITPEHWRTMDFAKLEFAGGTNPDA
jgi:PPOX class probable F420-dependent enzyme